jgi:hypothetical protein
MQKCVNVQQLADGILVRLFLISRHFSQDQRPDEATDWRHIAAATGGEIGRRGLSLEQIARSSRAAMRPTSPALWLPPTSSRPANAAASSEVSLANSF